MKIVTLNLPDNIASIFEALPTDRKLNAALLAAFFAQGKSKSMEAVIASIDKRVAESGLSEKEIDDLLDDLS
jgi:membrane-bound lytic murein transglycosylase B